jgi:hypothetical protein
MVESNFLTNDCFFLKKKPMIVFFEVRLMIAERIINLECDLNSLSFGWTFLREPTT